ncbi:MAG: hypothetical protein ACRDSL_19215 [Pseudonocardiaceae bacterium]
MAQYIKKTEGVYVAQTWVSRLWREHGLTPWQQGTFKISKDPHFEDKVRDVVGLYVDPITWTATADEIIDKVRAITSRMEALMRATEIDDVACQAA